MEEQQVILVNERDECIGSMEKMKAHRLGVLHRAFSIFIFDQKGQMLLQQRSADKYHGGLLWTNACCSHPYPGESTEQAADRRLFQELGFHTTLKELFSFTYCSQVENNLIEHEFDHVFVGEYEGSIHPSPNEVAAYEYRPMEKIREAINDEPASFTSWFRIVFPQIEKWWEKAYLTKAE